MTFPSSQQSQYQTRRQGDLGSFVSGDLVSGLIRHLYRLTRQTSSLTDLDLDCLARSLGMFEMAYY